MIKKPIDPLELSVSPMELGWAVDGKEQGTPLLKNLRLQSHRLAIAGGEQLLSRCATEFCSCRSSHEIVTVKVRHPNGRFCHRTLSIRSILYIIDCWQNLVSGIEQNSTHFIGRVETSVAPVGEHAKVLARIP